MSAHRHEDTDLLLAEARGGDLAASERLLDRHRDRLKAMVLYRMDRRLASRIDASDVVQESLLTAHESLPAYLDSPHIAFYPWLRRIAWNRLIDLHRRHVTAQRRSVDRELRIDSHLPDESAVYLADRLVASGTAPSRRLARAELRCLVQHALGQLRRLLDEGMGSSLP